MGSLIARNPQNMRELLYEIVLQNTFSIDIQQWSETQQIINLIWRVPMNLLALALLEPNTKA